MKNKPLTTAILLIIIMLFMLFWTYLFYVKMRQDLQIKSNIMENQRDILKNRVEHVKLRILFVPKNYHIAMVPMLVPGEVVVPKSVLKQLYSQGKGERER